MTENINLKEVEKKAFIRSHHEDGLFDIFLGIIFFSWGINIFLNNDYLHLIIVLIGLVAYGVTKKRVVQPRIGIVKFGKERLKSISMVTIVLTISLIFGIAMLFLQKLGLITKNLPLIVFVLPLTILLVFGLMAYFLSFNRLYGYSILLASSFTAFILMKEINKSQDGAYFIIATSILMIVNGTRLFVKFIKNYPIHEKDIHV